MSALLKMAGSALARNTTAEHNFKSLPDAKRKQLVDAFVAYARSLGDHAAAVEPTSHILRHMTIVVKKDAAPSIMHIFVNQAGNHVAREIHLVKKINTPFRDLTQEQLADVLIDSYNGRRAAGAIVRAGRISLRFGS